MPNVLPRPTSYMGIVVISEHLENLQIRKCSVLWIRVYDAVARFIVNNPIYKDIIIDQDAHINVVQQQLNAEVEVSREWLFR